MSHNNPKRVPDTSSQRRFQRAVNTAVQPSITSVYASSIGIAVLLMDSVDECLDLAELAEDMLRVAPGFSSLSRDERVSGGVLRCIGAFMIACNGFVQRKDLGDGEGNGGGEVWVVGARAAE